MTAETGTRASGWRGIATATIVDSVDSARILDGRIRHLAGPAMACGPAYPVYTPPGVFGPVRDAIEAAPTGAVLVLAGSAATDRAIWGEVSTLRAMRRGLAGVIVDGVVRDLDQMRGYSLPVFALGTCPRGPLPGDGDEKRASVVCGGVAIAAGDLVVGDLDGVVVIPAAVMDEGLRSARAATVRERARLDEVRASG